MKTRQIVLLGCLAALLLLAACQREPETAADVSLVAPTTTPAATATPPPALDVSIVRPTMTPLPTRAETAALAPAGSQPAEVAQVNEWLAWFPPAGWQTAVGPDGALVSPDLNNPGAPLLVIRRWGNPVDLSGWQAYVPAGQIERNGHASLLIAGRTWDGVFVTCPDYACRAFFAVSKSGSPTFSLLVYVPAAVDLTSSASPRESLYSLWDSEAVKLNATLQTLNIN